MGELQTPNCQLQIRGGCYPASVTPFRPDGEVDQPGMARLAAWFESRGCAGVVIAGTNGEGPSLSAIEKRDLLRAMMPVRGKLDLILGVATPSLSEAVWSCKQAAKIGASAALVMAPGYFREATEEGIHDWFVRLMDEAGLPVIVYNFPQRTGVTITPDLMARLASHERMAGAKDSSGSRENLGGYAAALPGKALFVGNETLLTEALRAGWSGTISGAANILANWLSQIVALWLADDLEQAEVKFRLIHPALEAIRKSPQPATNKAVLARLGVLDSGRVRLPLAEAASLDALMPALEGLTG
ncbi:MAG TPA: dihydrodipicolinate synthase family protein [Fimbriimonadaceae bacterium]|nr:dihydrodipicolinate synthase family protein [Fimbriimonadaceae bacterium]